MRDDILDDGFLKRIEIRNKNDIKVALKEAGFNNFFEHKNGSIIVKESDAVKISIHYENDLIKIKPQFPQIGNSIQVLSSVVILAIFLFAISVPFPLQWVIAIIGGQLVSYLLYMPITRALKARIERYI